MADPAVNIGDDAADGLFVLAAGSATGQPSQWPHIDDLTTPRSATVVIAKDDRDVIGT